MWVWEWRGVRWHTDIVIHQRELLNTHSRTCKEWMMPTKYISLHMAPGKSLFLAKYPVLASYLYSNKNFFNWKFSRSLTWLLPVPDTSNFTSFLIFQHRKISIARPGSKIDPIFILWIIDSYVDTRYIIPFSYDYVSDNLITKVIFSYVNLGRNASFKVQFSFKAFGNILPLWVCHRFWIT